MHWTLTGLLFCTCFVAVSSFACGGTKRQNFWLEMAIKADCKSRVSKFDACCATHDACYDRKGGRKKCDDALCSCMSAAAKGTLCVVGSYVMCKFVHWKGGDYYPG